MPDTKPDATSVRLHRRRVQPTPGSQLALFGQLQLHAFITRPGRRTLDPDRWPTRRRHGMRSGQTPAIRDPGSTAHIRASTTCPRAVFQPILSLPKGALLADQVIAHNLRLRWTARIGLGEHVTTTKTLRRRFFALAGRLTRSARRLTLHLPEPAPGGQPQGWRWGNQFSSALARLRALPLPS